MDSANFTIELLGFELKCHYLHKFTKKVEDAILKYPKLIGLDCETKIHDRYKKLGNASALDPYYACPRLVSFCCFPDIYVIDTNHVAVTKLRKILETKEFVAHNAIFDTTMLKRYAKASYININCTMLAAKLVSDATSSESLFAFNLKDLVSTFFDYELDKRGQVSDWSVPELTFEQIKYSAIDTVFLVPMFRKLQETLSKYQMDEYYDLIKKMIHPIIEMNLNGIKLDVEKHIKLIPGWREDLFKAKQELIKILGTETISTTTIGKWLEENLPDDVKQIWPKTKTRRLAASADTFLDYDWLEVVKPFSAYQKMLKLTSTYGMQLVYAVHGVTNRIHSNYKLCGARTGRLSCSHPNLQNIPRSSMRGNFIAEEGNVLTCADYSQIELRVAAELTRDARMLTAFKVGTDLHKLTAAGVMGKQEVTKEERNAAKPINFGFLFGLSGNSFPKYAQKLYGLKVDLATGKEFKKKYFALYPGIKKWQDKQVDLGTKYRISRTPYGKVRKLSEENTYGASMNTPIQGGAAECIMWSLVFLEERLRGSGIKLIGCVHDEILLECRSKYCAKAKSVLELSMMDGFLKVFPNGTLRGCTIEERSKSICECHSGQNWKEAK